MKTETGTVVFIGEIIPKSDKFKKRDIVIRQDLQGRSGPYSNFIKFQLLQEKVTYIDQFPLGSFVDVSFDLKGREVKKDGETVYYTNVDAWKIVLSAAQPPVVAPVTQAPAAQAPAAAAPVVEQGVKPAPEGAVNPGDTGDPAGGADNGPDDLPF